MTELNEKDFLRTFILELILVQKDSVFDLWDVEWIDIPDNFIDVIDEITNDEVKREEYSSIVPKEKKDTWKKNVSLAYQEYLTSSGVTHKDIDNGKRVTLNREAISNTLFDKSIDLKTKVKVGRLSEEFLGRQLSEKYKAMKLI